METTFHIPMWLLSNVGGFVGFGIFSLLLVKYRRRLRSPYHQGWYVHRVSNKRRAEKCKANEEKRNEKLREKEQKRLEKETKKMKLSRVLPGVWRRLYDILRDEKKATKDFVLLASSVFQRDVLDPLMKRDGVPTLGPAGLEALLDVSYYNLAGKGNCHKEVREMFERYVKFPEAFPEAD